MDAYYSRKYNQLPSNLQFGVESAELFFQWAGAAFYISGWISCAIVLSQKRRGGNTVLKNSILGSVLLALIWVLYELGSPQRASAPLGGGEATTRRDEVAELPKISDEHVVESPRNPLIACSVLLSLVVSLIFLHRSVADTRKSLLTVFASILIVFAEYVLLPLQRQFSISDGLGAPLIILGWVILFKVFNEVGPIPNSTSSLELGNEALNLISTNKKVTIV
jgi:hypothetical protein